jgi:hypothetical protein
MEKTAGNKTSATPKSMPNAIRMAIREPVTAQSSFPLPSPSLPHQHNGPSVE